MTRVSRGFCGGEGRGRCFLDFWEAICNYLSRAIVVFVLDLQYVRVKADPRGAINSCMQDVLRRTSCVGLRRWCKCSL
jgi:hypothetical protein